MGDEVREDRPPRGGRRRVKGPRVPGDRGRKDTCLSLSAEARLVLDRHSTEAPGQPSWSAIVEGLVLEHVPRYRVALIPRGVRVSEDPAAEVA